MMSATGPVGPVGPGGPMMVGTDPMDDGDTAGASMPSGPRQRATTVGGGVIITESIGITLRESVTA
jgi:hypothetical protein